MKEIVENMSYADEGLKKLLKDAIREAHSED